MDARHDRNSLRRMRLFATEADLTPGMVAKIMRPVIDEWRPIAVPNLKDFQKPMDPNFQLSQPALGDLSARIRAIGMNLNKSPLRGIHYHNALVRQVAALAVTFDCRGWTEAAAVFDDPENVATSEAPEALTTEEPPIQIKGRADVLWARNRTPVAVFEVDSTVKVRSFQKLKEAAAPHKLWIYFGKDLWAFRTFLQKNDPAKEIVPIIVPRTFIPSFDDEQD